ncbi:methyltransferase domain-containing protein [Roseomonas frigidaquae]|uniref:Methyltransferase domain-containing protein n=1 Tax=Falsiroseomonas frigidaquae TaxID=487318 RepID=A0ABX1F6I6_9PROT|nr:SAM-dependent methyltransferase [Falsiroseomonas frigidaquae]NKE48006.1 methyltransferase domain-containing protein [Falsiroseomonas frigidaquae]
MTRASLPPDYFEALYQADPDPWRFAESDYERDKYAATLAALPRPRYASAFEAGCSIGVLTAALAPRCGALLAVDAAAAPLHTARARCAALPQVSLRQAVLPADWPEATFDLMLFSEVLYYLDQDDLARLALRVAESLAPEADILLVHWTGETDYPLTGDAAAEAFCTALSHRADVTWRSRADRYRLDLLRAR